MKLLSTTNCKCITILLFILLICLNCVYSHKLPVEHLEQRQLFFGGKTKETNPPNFFRLVAMRLIYGLASTMGVEERLEELFNGAFVPPNADNDVLGLFGGSNDDDDDGDEAVGFAASDYTELFYDY